MFNHLVKVMALTICVNRFVWKMEHDSYQLGALTSISI